MSYLAIQVLGPVCAWEVDDDGIWRPLPLRAGSMGAAILVALVFHRELDGQEWHKVGAHLCSRVELDNDRDKVGGRTRIQAFRLRPQLGQHKDAISEGAAGIKGRGETVRIDWDYFLAYQGKKEHKRALSLIRGGPLVKVRSTNELKIESLREDVHNKIKEAAYKSLEKRECPVPADHGALDLFDPIFEQFWDDRPAEWRHRREAAKPPIPQSLRRQTEPPPPYSSYSPDELFEPCPEGEQFLAREMAEASDDGIWWSGEGEWMGAFFAFWHKLYTTPCNEVAITYTDEQYNAERFGVAPETNGPKDKATIIDARDLLSDPPKKEIRCAVTNWGFAYDWAGEHGDELLAQSPPASIFGLTRRPVYPGIAGVHVIFQTSDGYLLFGLRAPGIAFHERTWSASFQEQIAVGPREFTGEAEGGDRTLLDTVHGGLYEEWFIEEGAVAETSCLAVGREWGRSTFEGKPFINRSATIIVACRLNIPLATVWARLNERARVRDREEHRAWAGIHFGSRADVLRFVAAARGREDTTNLLAELCNREDIDAKLALYPGGMTTSIRDRGLMPTSAARLVLGSGWLASLPAD
jgi:hypothetical protein